MTTIQLQNSTIEKNQGLTIYSQSLCISMKTS